MNKSLQPLLATCLLLASTVTWPQQNQSSNRGRLLYETHCIACHSTEVHWRDKRTANDYAALRDQVRRWQDTLGLQWSEGDVLEVAGNLNDAIYHYPRPVKEARTR